MEKFVKHFELKLKWFREKKEKEPKEPKKRGRKPLNSSTEEGVDLNDQTEKKPKR